MTSSKNEPAYFCFVTDKQGYWYRIPVKKREEFFDWSENYKKYEKELNLDDLADVPDFNDYRCMHPINYMFNEIKVLKEST